MSRKQITEYLVADLEREKWLCSRCGETLGPLRDNYKKYVLLYERDPRDISPPIPGADGPGFGPDPEWCRIIEFYCPYCGTMIEVENLPPGHPLTHDIELDVDNLKESHLHRKEGLG